MVFSMQRSNGAPRVFAQLGSLVLPITAALVVPWLILSYDGRLQELGSAPAWRLVVGALLGAAGLGMLAWTVSLFVRIGRGTLAPWDATRKLVVAGPYAHVRNPMISGVFTLLVGEAVAFDLGVGVWAALFFVINHVYFVFSEEPGLIERFGHEYAEYRREVPRWIPRLGGYRPHQMTQ